MLWVVFAAVDCVVIVFRFVERLLVFGFGLVVCFVVSGLVVCYGFGFLGFGLRVFVKELLVCRY